MVRKHPDKKILKRRIKNAGFSQEQIAIKIGLTPSMLRSKLNGWSRLTTDESRTINSLLRGEIEGAKVVTEETISNSSLKFMMDQSNITVHDLSKELGIGRYKLHTYLRKDFAPKTIQRLVKRAIKKLSNGRLPHK